MLVLTTSLGQDSDTSWMQVCGGTRLCLFPSALDASALPRAPQNGSDPLRDSHIYPAASQCEEQGLTVLQGSVAAAPL
ncbi:unnamed protein product [Rangifer tarandus platyrhynchus]|uniref:Uncharacterized protein n=1 Tax=Rangifer tarandus platyrhynchus TaxID=3082113 RepID=A0AC59ZSI1_RANTA